MYLDKEGEVQNTKQNLPYLEEIVDLFNSIGYIVEDIFPYESVAKELEGHMAYDIYVKLDGDVVNTPFYIYIDGDQDVYWRDYDRNERLGNLYNLRDMRMNLSYILGPIKPGSWENKKSLKEQEKDIRHYLDSTYLKTAKQAGLTKRENVAAILDTIKTAVDNNFKLVMIRPSFVEIARDYIDKNDSDVLIGTVIDFPDGRGTTSEKVHEAMEMIDSGADELDYVTDYIAFKNGNLEKFNEDILQGTGIGLKHGKIVKWIIETGALTKEEILEISKLISSIVMNNFPSEAQNVFIKTSTGAYNETGATIKDVQLMKSVSGDLPIKASGGVYNREDLNKMINAGATRVGTSRALDIYLGKETDENGY
jgi:deoxyribose-phosphate aldolase